MEYRSRSVRLDDEVWAALQKHEFSANKLLRLVMGLEKSQVTVNTADSRYATYPDTDLDAVGPPLSDGRGKASAETRRPLREKGDGKR